MLRSQPYPLTITIVLLLLTNACGTGKAPDKTSSAAETSSETAPPYPLPAPRPAAAPSSPKPAEAFPPSPVLESRAGPTERLVIHTPTAHPHKPNQNKVVARAEVPVADTADTLRNYSVLAATVPLITDAGPLHKLTVWIGSQEKSAKKQKTFAAGLTVAETPFNSPTSNSARITPKSTIPGVKFDPEKICSNIDLQGDGSSKDFYWQLPSTTPNTTFEVGAEVGLYGSTDCSGTATDNDPKSVAIRVALVQESGLTRFFKQILSATEKGFLDFWGKFVAIFFALLLFLVRKKLFAWCGFKQDKENGKSE